jgi:CRISPR-associated endonuclease/helicase Cas3
MFVALAKTSRDTAGNIISRHSLSGHSADVAACCEMLLKKTMLGDKFAAFTGRTKLSKELIARLSFLAGLHDLGKVNVAFQAKLKGSAENFRAGHVTPLVGMLLNNGDQRLRSIRSAFFQQCHWKKLASWADSDEVFCAYWDALLHHHGKPVDKSNNRTWYQKGFWETCEDYDPIAEAGKLVNLFVDCYPEAFEEIQDESTEALLPSSKRFQHAFAGLVTLADWIASDSNLFSHDQGIYRGIEWSRGCAQRVLKDLWWYLKSPVRPTDMDIEKAVFKALDIKAWRSCQGAVANIALQQQASLLLLESETGSGKTEAALLYFMRMLDAGHVQGMFFAVPTRAAASQLHRRIKTVVKAMWGDDAPPVILAVPGYAAAATTESNVLNPHSHLCEEDSSAWVQLQCWAAENSKRYCSAPIVIGTIDQALFATLQIKHAHMRWTSLLKHLIVVDETHACDAYMQALLCHLLRSHRAAGGHALLMSATLDCTSAQQLFRAYGCKLPLHAFVEDSQREYPLLSYSSKGAVCNVPIKAHSSMEKKIAVTGWEDIAADYLALAQHVLDAAEGGARVLVIRNTRAAAVALQKVIEETAIARGIYHLLFKSSDIASPHHSRYGREDRLCLDAAIEQAFGKGHTVHGVVAIATQTVEQSLDIDADLLISDLCPIDIMLQRCGRLHRHQRHRPAGYEHPQLLVLMPAEPLHSYITRDGSGKGPDGYGTVYSDLLALELTRRLIATYPLWNIPVDNRYLVEHALHTAKKRELQLEDELWKKHHHYLTGAVSAKKGMAALGLIDFEEWYAESVFPSEDIPTTRLGLRDATVTFNQTVVSPFGKQLKKLNIPALWLPENVTEEQLLVAVKIDASGEITFSIQDKSFFYSRFGLQLISGE